MVLVHNFYNEVNTRHTVLSIGKLPKYYPASGKPFRCQWLLPAVLTNDKEKWGVQRLLASLEEESSVLLVLTCTVLTAAKQGHSSQTMRSVCNQHDTAILWKTDPLIWLCKVMLSPLGVLTSGGLQMASFSTAPIALFHPEALQGWSTINTLVSDLTPPLAHLTGKITNCIYLLLLWPHQSMQEAHLQERSLTPLCCGVPAPRNPAPLVQLHVSVLRCSCSSLTEQLYSLFLSMVWPLERAMV